MNGAVIVAVILVIIAVASISFLVSNPTGMVVSPSGPEASIQPALPRYIFYETPRVYPNMAYMDTCFPSGEVMPVIPNATCCENLEELGIIDEAQEGCNFIMGGALCSDCGNSRCEYGENNCNCPEDCNLPVPA